MCICYKCMFMLTHMHVLMLLLVCISTLARTYHYLFSKKILYCADHT